MASRIQGITVEIGGDTTKLSKALESVNKSIKGTQSGLKDVNKLLKLDPSNTELVVQKQKMLKDVVSFLSPLLTGIQTRMSTAWNAIKTVISTVLSAIQSTVSSIWASFFVLTRINHRQHLCVPA